MATLTTLAAVLAMAAVSGGAVSAVNTPDEAPPAEAPPAEAPPAEAPPAEAPAEAEIEMVPMKPPVENVLDQAYPEPEPEAKEMEGGGIGRPPWGILSSTVTAPDTTTPVGALKSAVSQVLSVKIDSKQLQAQLIQITGQIQTAVGEVFKFEQKISEVQRLYSAQRAIFAQKLGLSKNAETTANTYLKKISSQGQQLGKNDPKVKEKQAEIDKATGDEKKRLEKEKQDMMQSKPVDDSVLKEWMRIYSEAITNKVEADDEMEDAKREKDKLFAEIKDYRDKMEKIEASVTDLKAKRDALLGQIRAEVNAREAKVQPFVDWEKRKERYGIAIRRLAEAQTVFQAFLTDIWVPLERTPERRVPYQAKFDALEAAVKSARADAEVARTALTAKASSSITVASSELKTFIFEIEDITRNAVDQRGNILPAYQWNNAIAGYPSAVKALKDIVRKPAIQNAAEIYYEIAGMDRVSLIRNSSKFIDYFKRVLGSGLRGPERLKQEGSLVTTDLSQELVQKYVLQLLGQSANAVRIFPRNPTPNMYEKVYADLRIKVDDFVDKQIFSIKKMLENIRNARRGLSPSDIYGKTMLELETLAKKAFPILDTVPPTGQCQRVFPDKMFEILKSGKFKNVDILNNILGDGGNTNLKDEFLDEIKFARITSFIEAQQFSKQPRTNTVLALDLMRRSAFDEYTKTIETEAYNNPDDNTVHRNSHAQSIRDQIFALPAAQLNNRTINGIIRGLALPAGNAIPNQTFARQLDALTQRPDTEFKPSVHLRDKTGLFQSIQVFKDACEIDGNVGHGKVYFTRIGDILNKIETLEKTQNEPENELDKLIVKLTEEKRISRGRPDQAQAVGKLGEHGFYNGLENWAIVRVEKQDRLLNFMEAFLTLRSPLFRSITYDDSIVFKGKSQNTRNVYARLAFDELMKRASFDGKKIDSKPEIADWERIGLEFNMNFVIFKQEKVPSADISISAIRTQGRQYYIFQDSSGKFYPVRRQATVINAPSLPTMRERGNIGTYNRSTIGFGGAIDTPEFEVIDKAKTDDAARAKNLKYQEETKRLIKEKQEAEREASAKAREVKLYNPDGPELVPVSFETIKKSNPEISRLLDVLVEKVKAPKYNNDIAKIMLELWPTRRTSPVTKTQVTQDEIIAELDNPCFILDLEQISRKINEIGKTGDPLEDKSLTIKSQLIIVVGGFAKHHEAADVRLNEDETLKSARSVRGALRFGRPPCNLKMLRSDFDNLNKPDQETVTKHYTGNGIPDYLINTDDDVLLRPQPFNADPNALAPASVPVAEDMVEPNRAAISDLFKTAAPAPAAPAAPAPAPARRRATLINRAQQAVALASRKGGLRYTKRKF